IDPHESASSAWVRLGHVTQVEGWLGRYTRVMNYPLFFALTSLWPGLWSALMAWHAYDAEPGSDPLRKVPNRSFWAATVSSLLPGLMVLGYAYQLSLKPSPGGWIDLSGLVIVALGMLGLGMLMFTPVVGALAALGARTGHQRKGRVGGVLGAGLGGGSALPIGLLVLYLAILSH
ncbi:MAG: hypothetical protein KC910_32580, partial [Candidatus Eremiobacteraeota bacterium]|nr:hypothetical protein [Candidatus Eremiobacteraeota bacterium]